MRGALAEIREVLAELATTNKRVFSDVAELLKHLGLEEYQDKFEEQACSSVELVKKLDDGVLKDAFGIEKKGHRLLLLNEFRFL